jgi:mono/diheme cytochrome c family protein
MKTSILWSLALLLIGYGMVWNPRPLQAQAQDGQGIYNTKCAMCHGADGKGKGPAAAALSPPPADFNTSAFWQNTSDAKITDTIENGKGQMPASDLSPAQVKAVIDYMTKAFKPRS